MDSLDRFGDPSNPRTALVRNLYDRGCSLDQCIARREFVAFGASECRRNLGFNPAVSKCRILDTRFALGARGRRRPHADRPRMAPSGRSQKPRTANRTTLSAGPRFGPQSLQGFRKRTTDACDGDCEPQEPIDGQSVCQSRLVLALRRGARSDRRQLRADGTGAEPSGAFGSPRERLSPRGLVDQAIDTGDRHDAGLETFEHSDGLGEPKRPSESVGLALPLASSRSRIDSRHPFVGRRQFASP